MVFENLSLFELHLENSRFGPSFGADDDEEVAVDAEAVEESSGGRGAGRFVGMLLFVGLVAFAVRRYRARGDDGMEQADLDEITIEEAAEA